jgi:hypothetical protein
MNAKQPQRAPDRKPAPPPPPPALPLKRGLTPEKVERLYERYSSMQVSDWSEGFDAIVFAKSEGIGKKERLQFAAYVQGYIDGEEGKK